MKKIKGFLQSLNLNFKKEVCLYLSINLIFIGLAVTIYVLTNNLFFLSIIILIDVFCNVALIMRYSFIKDKILKSHEDEFIYFIQYLEIFLSNGYNVYSSFIAIKSFMSYWMQDRIDELTLAIDQDKTIAPYIAFSKNFKTPIVSNVMMNIFQMVNQGEDVKKLEQFDLLFIRFFENHQELETIKTKKSMDNLSIFPLIGAGIITIMLIVGVVIIMEDMINVL